MTVTATELQDHATKNLRRICKISIGPLTDPDWHIEINSLITNKLPIRLYIWDTSVEIAKKFDHLVLADPMFNNIVHS